MDDYTGRAPLSGAGVTIHAVKPYLRALATIGFCVSILSGIVWTQAPPTKKLLFLTHPGLYKHASLEPAEAAVWAL